MKNCKNPVSLVTSFIMIFGLLFNIVYAIVTGRVSTFIYNCANTIGIIQSVMVIILLLTEDDTQ